jgi:ABC-type glycerol-3-phosphate transport system permease component
MNSSIKKNIEIMDIRQFGKRLMLYSAVIVSISIVCFPMLYIVLASFKSGADLSAVPPTLFPTEWTFSNYIELFRQSDFLTYFKNSLILAVIATALSIIFGSVGAYSLSRFDFKPIQIFGSISLLSYMLPEVLIVIPLYVYVVNLGIHDTITSLVIANIAFTIPLTLWFMKSYFNAIPIALEESAMIDGNTRFQAFRKVTLPLALPGLVSVGIFSFNHTWNEFIFALIFISSDKKSVLPLAVAKWMGQDTIHDWGIMIAASVLIIIPTLIFYLIIQKQLITGMASGGVKGG